MITSQKGIDFIKSFEKCSLKPYIDSAGIATIGWGNTFYPNGKRVTIKDPAITQVYANLLFSVVVTSFEKDLDFLLGKISVSQNQYDALISFAYNVGSDIDSDTIAEGLGDSTLLKKVINNPNDITIVNEFMKWNKAGGKVLNGLTKRRKAESQIYSKGIYVNHI